MPAIALEGQLSTGHGCWPPTPCIGPYSSTVRINGKRVQLKGVSMYESHTCNKVTHPSQNRHVIADPEKEDTIFIEGIAAAMIGDLIECGDRVAKGSDDVFGGY